MSAVVWLRGVTIALLVFTGAILCRRVFHYLPLATFRRSLGDIPRSLSPRWVASKVQDGGGRASCCAHGCFLVALMCWVALPFASLVVWRVHTRLDAFDLEAALNETLGGVPEFELAVSRGEAVKLPSPEFRATLPPALLHLLADHADPVVISQPICRCV